MTASPSPHVDSLADSRADSRAESLAESLAVDLGARSYDILVGDDLLAGAGARIAPLARTGHVVVVTDANVAPLHLDRLMASLAAAGLRADAITLPAGEATKSLTHLDGLIDRILGLGVERATLLVALGGGVIGDIVGFAAAVTLRGMDFVQIPTTLLAQVDSSVGGKTGINCRHGKNLIGAFHQPRLVLADMDVLETLPERELLAGYAEVAKYGLIDDPDLFAWLEVNGPALCQGGGNARPLRRQAVVASCRAKARVVAEDELETGRRALLNLGHTFGHALEAECAYDGRLLHGEAVAIGMVMAFDLSVRLGLCPAADADRARAHLAAVGLPTDIRALRRDDWTAERLMAHMGKDKKVLEGRLTFILARGIGQSFITREVAADDLRTFLEETLTA